MARFTIIAVFCLFSALVAFDARSAPIENEAAVDKGATAAQQNSPKLRGIPGYGLLRINYVQDQLGLTKEQKDKLHAIGNKYYEEMRKDWANIYNLTKEKRDAAMIAVRKKAASAMEAVREQVEIILSPEQIEKLEDIHLKVHGPSILENVRNTDFLKITAEQKEELQKLREEMRKHYRQARDDLWDKVLDVLTPEQKAKLKEMSKPGFMQRLYSKGGKNADKTN